MLFLVCSVLRFFLLAIMARDKPDATAIFLVNLLFGWTIIGWFMALIWASAEGRYIPVPAVPVSSGRLCSQGGRLSPYGAHFCSACGKAV